MRLDVSVRAEEDLADIFTYSSIRWGLVQADDYLDILYKGFFLLCDNPEMGMYHPHLDNIRKFPLKQHIVFYRVRDDHLKIIRVLHKSADAKRAFFV